MVTRSSRSWLVRKERITRLGWMVPSVHIGDDKINWLLTMSIVVSQLPKLWRKVKNDIRTIAIEITKEQELGFWKPHLEQIVVH